MNVIHRATTRGHADHGWLQSFHTFSFANYHNPQRMGFGLLRVLNDDYIAEAKGFDTHSHRDMEIITVPIQGIVKHKDSEGHEGLIQEGDVQLMSAGKGVAHSEYNGSPHSRVNLLQIWILPKKHGIDPRYDQRTMPREGRQNRFQLVVSPLGTDLDGIKINQDAHLSLADLDSGIETTYKTYLEDCGVYVFVISGEITLFDETLRDRDAMGVTEKYEVPIKAIKTSKILVIEVPMKSK